MLYIYFKTWSLQYCVYMYIRFFKDEWTVMLDLTDSGESTSMDLVILEENTGLVRLNESYYK